MFDPRVGPIFLIHFFIHFFIHLFIHFFNPLFNHFFQKNPLFYRHNNEYCAPLTSFDWNEIDPTILGTSSIDTTCTIWNIETGQSIGSTAPIERSNQSKGLEAVVKTQLIAHDKEVYDISFSRGVSGRDQFASVGADGSVRMFDLRALEHSTIIFESAQASRDQPRTPLVRLAWNKQDPNYLATMPLDSTEIIILDVRVPCTEY